MPGTGFKVAPAVLSHPSQLDLDLDNSKFCSYDAKNPQVYESFKRITMKTITKGFANYSAKGILELIRWHSGVSAEGDVFKVNNNYSSFYARKFEKEFPEYKDFFRKRNSKFD
jgi:hypothetical protein